MNRTFLERSVALALICGAVGVAVGGLNACGEFDATRGPESAGAGGAGSTMSVGGMGGGTDVTSAGVGTGGDAGRGTDLDAGPPPPPPDADVLFVPSGCESANIEPVVYYMSADDSNSMASPALVREYIYNGFEPGTSKVRSHEFLNYYHVGYEPKFVDDLTIIPEMEKNVEMPVLADLQIGIRSFNAPAARRNMVFTFVVDTSGSMKGEGLKRAKAAVHALRSQFVKNDIVNFYTTGSSGPLLDKQIMTGNDDQVLKGVADALVAGGDTNLYQAINDAYGKAKDSYENGKMNRVILISDGGTNVGTTDESIIVQESADADKEGIYLVGIGTGPASSYNDSLMNKLTDVGRGAYVYLDKAEEAANVLAARFDETMDIAARSVQVELTLPWYFKAKSESTEYPISPNKVEPQHLAPNDAMVFFLNTEVCDPSMYERNDEGRIRVFWKRRDKFEAEITEAKFKINELFATSASPTMAKARAIVAFAEALKGCGKDVNGKSLCKDEAQRKQVVRNNLLKARALMVTALNGKPNLQLDEIIALIDQHPLIKN